MSLSYVDIVMTVLGAGDVACSSASSGGVHLLADDEGQVVLNDQSTSLFICLPILGVVEQI